MRKLISLVPILAAIATVSPHAFADAAKKEGTAAQEKSPKKDKSAKPAKAHSKAAPKKAKPKG